MASSDLNELFEAAVSFAETMLAKEGEFIPFGVSMDLIGKVALVAGDVGSEHPASTEVIALLQSSFQQSAARGSIRAAGVCLDVRVTPPGTAARSDAICVRLAHVSGEVVEVYVPYTGQSGTYQYGQVFATQASAFRVVEA
jgi:hypothetical protein